MIIKIVGILIINSMINEIKIIQIFWKFIAEKCLIPYEIPRILSFANDLHIGYFEKLNVY